MTNSDLQNTTQKTEDGETRTSLKPAMNSCAPDRYVVSTPLVAPVVLL